MEKGRRRKKKKKKKNERRRRGESRGNNVKIVEFRNATLTML